MISSKSFPSVNSLFSLILSTTLTVTLGMALAGCSTESRRGKTILGDVADFDRTEGTNFRVDTVKTNQVSIVKFTDSGTPQKKQYTFIACLKDMSAAALLPGRPFTIADGKDFSLSLNTDINGCLTWVESHEFNFLQAETYFKFRRTVTANATYRGTVTMDLAFSPWAEAAGALVDLRYNRLPIEGALEDVGVISMGGAKLSSLRPKDTSVFVTLNTMSFEFLKMGNFKITPNLALNVAHKYRVRLSPVVIRRSLSKVVNTEVLNSVRMRTYVSLFREVDDAAQQFDPKNLITSVNFEGQLYLGTLIKDVDIGFEDISDLSSRTVALVTLVPLDDEVTGIGEPSFMGPLKPGPLAALNLIPTNAANARVVAESAARQREAGRLAPIDLFAKKMGMKALDTQGEVSVRRGLFGLRGDHVVNYASATELFLKGKMSSDEVKTYTMALCSRLYEAGSSLAQSCLISPSDYISLENRQFVDTILSSPRKVNAAPIVETFTMAATLSKSQTKVESEVINAMAKLGASFSLGMDGSAGDLLKVALGVKLSAEGSYAVGLTRTWSESDGTSLTVARNVVLTAEGNTFQFEAKSRNCALIRPGASVAKFLEGRGTLPAGRFVCAKEAQQGTHVESYYLISQSGGVNNSAFSDPGAAADAPWRMFLRGPKVMELFRRILMNSSVEIVLNEVPEAQISTEFREFRTIQEYPGMLSRP